MIKIIKNAEEVFDFVWKTSQNDLTASYTRIKTKSEVEEILNRGVNRNDYSILACFLQEKLCGICVYYWLEDEKYAQTKTFLISENFEEVATEFIDFIKAKLPGFDLLIGFPLSNAIANQYFETNNFECIESSIDTRFYNLKEPSESQAAVIKKIKLDDFEEYALFHDKYALPAEMYYNSENLLKNIERFRVFAHRENGIIKGSIFASRHQDSAEIFGLFLDEEYSNRGIEDMLINAVLVNLYEEFGSLSHVAFFIEETDPEELASALAAGFEINDRYRCYKVKL